MHVEIFEVSWKRPHAYDFRWFPNSTLTRTRSAIVKKGCKLNDRYAKKRRQTFFSENLFGGKLLENSTVNQGNFPSSSKGKNLCFHFLHCNVSGWQDNGAPQVDASVVLVRAIEAFLQAVPMPCDQGETRIRHVEFVVVVFDLPQKAVL